MAITVGSVSNISSGQAVYYSSCMLDTNKVVAVYRDQAAGGGAQTKIVVGTVSETSISWGSAATINSGYYLDKDVTDIVALSSSLVVVCFKDTSDANTSKVVACTISDTTVTVGTPLSIDTLARNPKICKLGDSSFALFYYQYNTEKGMTVVGTVSTRTITLGTAVDCGYNPYYENKYSTIVGLDSTHFAISYQVSGVNYTALGTISSGTTHSLGSRQTIKDDALNGNIRVTRLSSTKFIYVYRNNKAVVCSCSGTTITVGDENNIASDIFTAYKFGVAALSENLIIIGGYNGTYKRFIAYTVDGSMITKEGTPTNSGRGEPYEKFLVSALSSSKFIGTWTVQNSYLQIVVGDYAPPVVAPTVTTQSATNIATTSCTGNGNITATGGENCTRRGFCYKAGTSGDPTTSDSVAYDDGDFGTGAFTKSITGLTAGTNYRVRAYAVNSAGTSYGTTVDVKTLSAFIPRTMWFN